MVENLMKWIRGKTKCRAMCAMLLLFVMLLPVGVYADPPEEEENKPVEHLVVVSDTDWFLDDLKQALYREEAEHADGNSLSEYENWEGKDHRFVAWSDNSAELTSRVLNAVTELRGAFPDSKVSVIFWNGFWQVDDVTTFTHEILNKVELDAFQKNKVEEEYQVQVPDPDNPDEMIWVTKTHIVDKVTDQKQYTFEIGTKTCHEKAAKRYADVAKDLKKELADRKVKDYWIGLPPNAIREDGVLKDGIDVYKEKYTTTEKVDGSGYKDHSELYGHWAQRWNQSLSTAGTVIDIWEAAHESKLYFTERVHMLGVNYQGEKVGPFTGVPSGEWVDGNEWNPPDPVENVVTKPGDNEWDDVDAQLSKQNAYAFYSYNDETYQTLFHIVLDHIQNINPLKESGEAITQDMYSISTGLTAYVNQALSPNAGEKQKDHKILKTKYVGNAGALFGYGDKDKGFTENLVTNLSKTSSTVAYKALKGDSQLDDAYLYASYGKLLSGMGIDEYGVKSSGVSIRGFSGAMMLLVYVLSLTAAKLFGYFIDLLILLNPFRFFVAIGGNFVGGLQQAVVAGDSGLSDGVQGIVLNPAFLTIAKLVSKIYNSLQEWSWGFMVPVGIAGTIVGVFLFSKLFGQHKPDTQVKKVLVMVGRIAFVAFGIPFLGILYTSTLSSLDFGTKDAKSASTQIVASTYVDFAGWVEKYRLDPVAGGVFELDTKSGNPTKDALAKLRDTALAINVATGAVDANVKGSEGGVSGTDDMDWSYNALVKGSSMEDETIKQCFDLITGYMNDGFYYPSDWEASVGQAMHQMVASGGFETGRRKGGEEKDFDAEMIQGDKTYYHMYDNINEMKDWTERDKEANDDIFDETKEKWKGFNILNNGRNITVSNVDDAVLIYKPTWSGTSGLGTYPTQVGGLSTISMYNYLSTRFHPNNMVMYSNEHSTNVASRYSHYAVTMIGEGILGFLYWANSFVLMIVIAILGLYYFIGGAVNVLKKGMHVITSLPGAALGLTKSIATILSTTFSMITEVISMGVLYIFVSELLVAFIGVINKIVVNISQGGTGELTTIHLFGSMDWTVSFETFLCLSLVVSTVAVLLFGVLLWYYRRAWNVAVIYVVDAVQERIVPCEVLFVMKEREEQKKQESSFIRIFLANVKELLYNQTQVQAV